MSADRIAVGQIDELSEPATGQYAAVSADRIAVGQIDVATASLYSGLYVCQPIG